MVKQGCAVAFEKKSTAQPLAALHEWYLAAQSVQGFHCIQLISDSHLFPPGQALTKTTVLCFLEVYQTAHHYQPPCCLIG